MDNCNDQTGARITKQILDCIIIYNVDSKYVMNNELTLEIIVATNLMKKGSFNLGPVVPMVIREDERRRRRPLGRTLEEKLLRRILLPRRPLSCKRRTPQRGTEKNGQVRKASNERPLRIYFDIGKGTETKQLSSSSANNLNSMNR